MPLTSRLAALWTVLAVGCGISGEPTPAEKAAEGCTQRDPDDCPSADERRALASRYRAELDAARARWGGRGDYFFCQERRDQACYTVSGGTLVGWYDPRDTGHTEPSYDGGPSILYMGQKTMDGVFSQVERHIDALEGKGTLPVDYLLVTYEPTFGYPVTIKAGGGMESWGYTVYNFRLLEPRPAEVPAE